MKKQFKQLGQGMTEYIIIIALIAIAGIGAFGFFGEGIKQTIGDVTAELTGNDQARTQVSEAGRLDTRDMTDFAASEGN